MSGDDEDVVQQLAVQFAKGKMRRKTFFRLMAAEGYQNIEALKLAESWDDE